MVVPQPDARSAEGEVCDKGTQKAKQDGQQSREQERAGGHGDDQGDALVDAGCGDIGSHCAGYVYAPQM
jgi:hypothetical protein